MPSTPTICSIYVAQTPAFYLRMFADDTCIYVRLQRGHSKLRRFMYVPWSGALQLSLFLYTQMQFLFNFVSQKVLLYISCYAQSTIYIKIT
jgi:hypothetical protein